MIEKDSKILAIGILISRALGYVRDMLIAFFFGVTKLSDAFFVAWAIPNTLRELIGEGGLYASFLPVYGKLYNEDRKKAERFASAFLFLLVCFAFLFVSLGIIFSWQIINILVPGFEKLNINHLATRLLQVLFPYLIFISLVAFFCGIFIFEKRFIIPAFSQVILNICFIGSMVLLADKISIASCVVGVLVGGVLQLLVCLIRIKSFNINIKFPKLSWLKTRYIFKSLKMLFFRLLSFGVVEANFFVSRFFASLLPTGGGVSALYFSFRLIHLAVAVFAIPTSMAKLQAFIKTENFFAFKKTAKKLAVISVIISFIYIILGEGIIKVLFQRGNFDLQATDLTYQALVFYSIGLLPIFLNNFLTSFFFYAKNNTKIPFYGSLISFISNCIFCILLTKQMGIGGITLAASLSSWIAFLYLWKNASKSNK